MVMTRNKTNRVGAWILSLLLVAMLPGILSAQVFSFSVDNLEGYDRSVNWMFDVDNPGIPFFSYTNGQWQDYGVTSQHLLAEKNVVPGTTPGHVTGINCIAENTDLAAAPGEITLVFTQPFLLSSFVKYNTGGHADWWNIGMAADVRTYSNAKGYIAHNGTPKLYLDNATFVVTTYYPTQAQIRTYSPILNTWIGDIGTGANQTAYGFGNIDVGASDPAWAALFAASDYRVKMPMVGIVSETTLEKSWMDFTMDIDLADAPYNNGAGGTFDTTLPVVPIDFPDQNVLLDINTWTTVLGDGTTHYFFVNEIQATPTGVPVEFNSVAKKYWTINTTLATFDVDLTFTLNQSDFVAAKTPADWKVYYRVNDLSPWLEWASYTPVLPNKIKANNVTAKYEFAVFSTVDETLPVTLTSFTATTTSANQIAVAWSTASESSMNGYKVYFKETGSLDALHCLTPIIIPAHNETDGADYSFLASDIETPGTYSFWLEAISMDGSSDFHGPVSATLSDNQTPPLPVRNTLSYAFPNPFRIGTSTSIAVEMKAGETGKVTVYNIMGQVVKNYSLTQGIQTLIWDGLDTKGNACASGVYFFKLSSPSLSQTKKMVLVR